MDHGGLVAASAAGGRDDTSSNTLSLSPPEQTYLAHPPARRKSPASLFRPDGPLRPFRLLKSDLNGRGKLWHTDWHFNQLILASAVYVFFTNLLPGITFSSDLYVQTEMNYGTIEVVFSTGLCGVIFGL
jgi:hypothetical protein